MKKIFTAIAFAAALFAAIPSQAQVKFGLKGGYNVTNMSISSDVVKKSNQTGFFIGPTAKITLPIVGLGLDIAALYDQREAKWGEDDDATTISEKNINIPINVRYGIGLGSMASIYFAAGPQFGFNVGGKNYKWSDAANYELKKSNISINLGAGVALMNHLEIGCTYNIACGKTGEFKLSDALGSTYDQITSKSNRTNAWQIYAAYYF
jgi:opacity protein-like surface antigen